METKDFLRGILKKDSMPQVLNFQGGVLVPTVAVDANQVASYIDGLSKYERMLLKLRISRHSRDASYLARHVDGVGSAKALQPCEIFSQGFFCLCRSCSESSQKAWY